MSTPNFQLPTPKGFRADRLRVLWELEVGSWDFQGAFSAHCQVWRSYAADKSQRARVRHVRDPERLSRATDAGPAGPDLHPLERNVERVSDDANQPCRGGAEDAG